MKKIQLILAIIILHSCAKPLLTNTHNNKYKSIEMKESPIGYNIGVLPLAVKDEPEPEKTKTFFDLKDTVQVKFLDVISKNTKKNDEIIKLIKQSLSDIKEEKPPKKKTDFTKITIRLSFTHYKEYLKDTMLYHPNTRLEFLNTKLRLSNTAISFYSIDKLENEFDIIDLGTIGRTKNVTFGTEISSEVGSSVEGTKKTSKVKGKNTGTNSYDSNDNNTASETNQDSNTNENNITTKNGATTNGKITYNNAEEIKEQVNVSLKRLKTGYAFDEKSLTISQRGKSLNDIVDGTIVTATFILKNGTNDQRKNVVSENEVSSFSKLWDEKDNPNTADKVTFNTRIVKYNNCSTGSNTFTIDGTYDGLIRIANNTKKNNTLEYDDNITYGKFVACPIPPVSVDLNQYCKKVFKIVIEDKKKKAIYTVHFASRNSASKELLFFEDDNYNEFINWLTRIIKKNDVKGLNSKIFNIYLNSDNVSVENIKVINEDPKPSDLKILKELLESNYLKALEYKENGD